MDKKNIIKCPFCKSENVTRKKYSGYVKLFSVLSLGLISPGNHDFYCYDCDSEWKMVKRKRRYHKHHSALKNT